MTSPSYIELVGLPGAGKTESAKMLVQHLHNDDILGALRVPISSTLWFKLKIVVGIVILLVRNPVLLRLWMFSVRKEYRDTPHVQSVVRNVRGRMIAEAVIATHLLAQDGAALVNDEGVIGKMVMLSILTGIEEGVVFGMLYRMVPNNTAIIHVDPPARLTIERMSKRNIDLPFFEEMDPDTKKKLYAESTGMYVKICETFRTMRSASIWSVHNTGTQSDLEQEVESIVRAFGRSKQ